MKIVVAPVNFSTRTAETLAAARRLALRDHGEVHVVNVMREGMDSPARDRICGERLARLAAVSAALSPVPYRTRLLFGRVAEAIAAYAGEVDADVIVLADGTRRSSHVTQSLVHLCKCPVMALRKAPRPRLHARGVRRSPRSRFEVDIGS